MLTFEYLGGRRGGRNFVDGPAVFGGAVLVELNQNGRPPYPGNANVPFVDGVALFAAVGRDPTIGFGSHIDWLRRLVMSTEGVVLALRRKIGANADVCVVLRPASIVVVAAIAYITEADFFSNLPATFSAMVAVIGSPSAKRFLRPPRCRRKSSRVRPSLQVRLHAVRCGDESKDTRCCGRKCCEDSMVFHHCCECEGRSPRSAMACRSRSRRTFSPFSHVMRPSLLVPCRTSLRRARAIFEP